MCEAWRQHAVAPLRSYLFSLASRSPRESRRRAVRQAPVSTANLATNGRVSPEISPAFQAEQEENQRSPASIFFFSTLHSAFGNSEFVIPLPSPLRKKAAPVSRSGFFDILRKRVSLAAYFFFAAFLAAFFATFLAAAFFAAAFLPGAFFAGLAAAPSSSAACAAARRATGTRYGEQDT
jgi:hypothetical protein